MNSYRVVGLKDCYFCVFSFDSSLCIDLIYGVECYNVKYAIDVKRCKDSAFLFDCQDCENCFSIQKSQNNKNLVRAYNAKNNNYGFGNMDSENVYLSVIIQDNCYNIKFCSNIIRSKNLEYCLNCQECEDCFLCASLVGKKYHILNKQYNRKEYEIEKTQL